MDSSTTNHIVTSLGDIVVLVGVILAIEWVFLPIAIFGIQSRLDDIRDGIAMTNALLREISKKQQYFLSPASNAGQE